MVVGLLRVPPEELLVGLLPVDVPGELGRGERVARGARHVDPVLDVVARLAALDVRSGVGEGWAGKEREREN